MTYTPSLIHIFSFACLYLMDMSFFKHNNYVMVIQPVSNLQPILGYWDHQGEEETGAEGQEKSQWVFSLKVVSWTTVATSSGIG